MKKSKYIIEKEIELLNESKNTDKFDYQIGVSIYIGMLVFMTSLVTILGYKNNLSFSAIAYLWLFFFLAITARFYFKIFKDVKKIFKRKHELVRENYKKLGINISAIDKKLERMKN